MNQRILITCHLDSGDVQDIPTTPLAIHKLSDMTCTQVAQFNQQDLILSSSGRVYEVNQPQIEALSPSDSKPWQNTIQIYQPLELIKVQKIAALGQVMILLDDAGEVLSMGQDETKKGILGQALNYSLSFPKTIDKLHNISDITLCPTHAAAVDDQGNLYTWGTGMNGELGQEKSQHVLSPTVCSSIGCIKVKQAYVQPGYTALLANGGYVYILGNINGQETSFLRQNFLAEKPKQKTLLSEVKQIISLKNYFIVSLQCNSNEIIAISNKNECLYVDQFLQCQVLNGQTKSVLFKSNRIFIIQQDGKVIEYMKKNKIQLSFQKQKSVQFFERSIEIPPTYKFQTILNVQGTHNLKLFIDCVQSKGNHHNNSLSGSSGLQLADDDTQDQDTFALFRRHDRTESKGSVALPPHGSRKIETMRAKFKESLESMFSMQTSIKDNSNLKAKTAKIRESLQTSNFKNSMGGRQQPTFYFDESSVKEDFDRTFQIETARKDYKFEANDSAVVEQETPTIPKMHPLNPYKRTRKNTGSFGPMSLMSIKPEQLSFGQRNRLTPQQDQPHQQQLEDEPMQILAEQPLEELLDSVQGVQTRYSRSRYEECEEDDDDLERDSNAIFDQSPLQVPLRSDSNPPQISSMASLDSQSIGPSKSIAQQPQVKSPNDIDSSLRHSIEQDTTHPYEGGRPIPEIINEANEPNDEDDDDGDAGQEDIDESLSVSVDPTCQKKQGIRNVGETLVKLQQELQKANEELEMIKHTYEQRDFSSIMDITDLKSFVMQSPMTKEPCPNGADISPTGQKVMEYMMHSQSRIMQEYDQFKEGITKLQNYMTSLKYHGLAQIFHHSQQEQLKETSAMKMINLLSQQHSEVQHGMMKLLFKKWKKQYKQEKMIEHMNQRNQKISNRRISLKRIAQCITTAQKDMKQQFINELINNCLAVKKSQQMKEKVIDMVVAVMKRQEGNMKQDGFNAIMKSNRIKGKLLDCLQIRLRQEEYFAACERECGFRAFKTNKSVQILYKLVVLVDRRVKALTLFKLMQGIELSRDIHKLVNTVTKIQQNYQLSQLNDTFNMLKKSSYKHPSPSPKPSPPHSISTTTAPTSTISLQSKIVLQMLFKTLKDLKQKQIARGFYELRLCSQIQKQKQMYQTPTLGVFPFISHQKKVSTDTNNRYNALKSPTQKDTFLEDEDSSQQKDELLVTISSRNETSNMEEYFTFKKTDDAHQSVATEGKENGNCTIMLNSSISNHCRSQITEVPKTQTVSPSKMSKTNSENFFKQFMKPQPQSSNTSHILDPSLPRQTSTHVFREVQNTTTSGSPPSKHEVSSPLSRQQSNPQTLFQLQNTDNFSIKEMEEDKFDSIGSPNDDPGKPSFAISQRDLQNLTKPSFNMSEIENETPIQTSRPALFSPKDSNHGGEFSHYPQFNQNQGLFSISPNSQRQLPQTAILIENNQEYGESSSQNRSSQMTSNASNQRQVNIIEYDPYNEPFAMLNKNTDQPIQSEPMELDQSQKTSLCSLSESSAAVSFAQQLTSARSSQQQQNIFGFQPTPATATPQQVYGQVSFQQTPNARQYQQYQNQIPRQTFGVIDQNSQPQVQDRLQNLWASNESPNKPKIPPTRNVVVEDQMEEQEIYYEEEEEENEQEQEEQQQHQEPNSDLAHVHNNQTPPAFLNPLHHRNSSSDDGSAITNVMQQKENQQTSFDKENENESMSVLTKDTKFLTAKQKYENEIAKKTSGSKAQRKNFIKQNMKAAISGSSSYRSYKEQIYRGNNQTTPIQNQKSTTPRGKSPNGSFVMKPQQQRPPLNRKSGNNTVIMGQVSSTQTTAKKNQTQASSSVHMAVSAAKMRKVSESNTPKKGFSKVTAATTRSSAMKKAPLTPSAGTSSSKQNCVAQPFTKHTGGADSTSKSSVYQQLLQSMKVKKQNLTPRNAKTQGRDGTVSKSPQGEQKGSSKKMQAKSRNYSPAENFLVKATASSFNPLLTQSTVTGSSSFGNGGRQTLGGNHPIKKGSSTVVTTSIKFH